jgi:hypothetical protein
MIREVLVVKNFLLEEILTVILAQLEGDLKGYMRVLNMTNRTKREKKNLNFVVAYDLMVANNFFRKKKPHLITFNSGQHSSGSILSLLEGMRDQTAWIVRLYLTSVSSHNTNF